MTTDEKANDAIFADLLAATVELSGFVASESGAIAAMDDGSGCRDAALRILHNLEVIEAKLDEAVERAREHVPAFAAAYGVAAALIGSRMFVAQLRSIVKEKKFNE